MPEVVEPQARHSGSVAGTAPVVPGQVLVQRPDTVRTGEQPPVGAAVGQLGDVLGQQGHQVVGQVHRALGPILGRAYLHFGPVLGEPGEDARDVLARLGADTFRKLIAPVPAASPEPEPSASMTMCADCGRDGTYRIDGRRSPCDAAHRAARTVMRRVSRRLCTGAGAVGARSRTRTARAAPDSSCWAPTGAPRTRPCPSGLRTRAGPPGRFRRRSGDLASVRCE